jgi:hypothetical protein
VLRNRRKQGMKAVDVSPDLIEDVIEGVSPGQMVITG